MNNNIFTVVNYIDLFISVVLIWFGYKGFSKGLIIELFSLIALGFGVYGGLKFSDTAAEYITGNIETKYIPIVSFTITFIIIVVSVFIIGKLIEKVINMVALKLANKLAGAVFGMLKVMLVLSVLITIIESYDQKLGFIPKQTKENSLLYTPLLEFSNKLLPEIEKNNLFKEVNTNDDTQNQ
jgi:membrane protein required for colicin V production